jgi:hypothetical protein
MNELPIYGTYYLYRLFQQLVPEPQIFYSTFFRATPVQSEKEEVHFDHVSGKKTGASPFVHPGLESPTFKNKGFSTSGITPAYIKEKIDLTPDRGRTRMEGEEYGGRLTQMQRLEILLARDVKTLQERWVNRLELMAIEAVKHAKLTIKGEGFNDTIDFGRDKSLNIRLSGDNSWANKAFPMRSFFEKTQALISQKSLRQRMPRQMWMSQSSYDLFIQNDEVQKILTVFQQSSQLRISIVPGAQSFETLVYKGNFGDIDIFVCQALDTYGNPYLGENQVLFHSGDVDGIPFFGAILDLDAGLMAQKVFLKSWDIKSPSVRFVELQSAPVLGVFDQNAAALMTVA